MLRIITQSINRVNFMPLHTYIVINYSQNLAQNSEITVVEEDGGINEMHPQHVHVC